MLINSSSLHQLDHTKDLIRQINITGQGEELNTYVQRLLTQIVDSRNRRKFKFRNNTTEVRSAISKILDDDFEDAVEIITARLLSKEKDAQEEYGHLGIEIQKGSLFQAYINHDGKDKVIISKADHSQFLDEVDFEIHRGLPWKKRVFKALLVEFDDEENVDSVYVHDTGSSISKYWWHDFLELQEVYTNKYNTSRSLDLIDRKVLSKIKSSYPSDHEILRNSTVGYFRNNVEFQLDDFIESIFQNYSKPDEAFPLDDLIERLEELPEKWDFDNRFGIDNESINKRAVHKINVHPHIELILKDHVEDFEQIISSFEDQEGNKFIKIRTDEDGYNRFKR